jgi:mannose-1-phosphate guanylyltransferase/mannose-6-phosphate isomerase
MGRNTAPAAAVAALRVAARDPDGLLLVMPSDHAVSDLAAFQAAVAAAARAARGGALVTFGIAPTAPETGYGYIKGGAALSGASGVRTVERFVEKPDRPTAEAYLASGDYYWNSGMFLFAASAFLAEMGRLEPTMLDCCRRALDAAERDADFLRLPKDIFANCSAQSIDYAIMEHTTKAAVVPVEMGWNDVGSWQALWDIAERDGDGNMVQGDVLLQDTRNSYIRSEGPLLATIGVTDIVVVATPDAVLVCHRGAAQEVKKIADEQERQTRPSHLQYPDGEKPA